MSDSGPTTAGSIVGRLRMDRDQWVADMAATKADAREIGSLRPTVRVDVDTTAALAKLETLRAAAERAGAIGPSVSTPAGPSAGASARVDAVAAAERRLAAAVTAADSAYARAELAQMRLNEAREKGITEGSRLAAAELTASEALKRLDAANERATLSEAALAAAQEKTARAALEKAAAEEADSRAMVKANEANSTNVSRIGMITTAVGLLLPLMVPVAAGAIGIAGALGMMGVAGIFAVVGIRKEMQQGTVVGNAYATGIGTLKANMAALAGTSAVSMLSSFRSVVGETNAAMPMLNRQVGQFTGLLGRSGANLFQGSITSLRILEPLLLSAGNYVERLTRKFDAWTSNGGLQQFANYALGVLPQVEEVLGALATAVMHILQALAPLGTIGMGVLTMVSNVISAIPVQVLSDLIGMITWGTLAFKAWGFIAPMLETIAWNMGALGTATTIATGPIGWVVAGIAALAAIFAVSTAATQKATAVTESYTAALKADSGAIGENVRQQAIQQLMASKSIAASEELGISAKTMTDAVLGNADAIKVVKDAVQAATDRYKTLSNVQNANGTANGDATRKAVKQKDAIDNVSAALGVNGAALQQAIRDQKLWNDANGVTTVSVQDQEAAVRSGAAAAGVTTDAYRAALAAQTDTKAELEKTTATMYLQNDAAGLLKQSLDLLNGKTLSSAQAQNQFDSQLANMSTHMDAAGKTINRADTLLTGMTASAVKNRGELINLTTAAEANAQAFRDNGGSAEDTRKKLIDMKQQIIDNAIAHGENADEVKAYVDQLFKIPDKIPATKIEVDTATAKAQLEAFIANVNSRVATINVRATMPDLNGDVSGSGRPGVANGGSIGHLAGGGSGTVTGRGTADSDTAGLYRLAHGEEVISNKFGQADRFRSLLKQINAGVVPSRARSAEAGSTSISTTHAPVVNATVNTAPGLSPRDAIRLMSDSINFALRGA